MKSLRQIFKFIVIRISFILWIATQLPFQILAQENKVDWHPIDDAVQIAEKKQRFILIDVWAPWCGWCKKMKKEVYPTLSKDISEQFVWTRLNQDDHESKLQFKNQSFTPFLLAKKLYVQEVPALVVLSPQAEYIFHTSGFTEADNLESLLIQLASISNM